MASVELRGTDQSRLTLSGLGRVFFGEGDHLAFDVERETDGGAWEREVLFCAGGGASSNVGVWSGPSELELAFCHDKKMDASITYRLRLPATNPPVSDGDNTSPMVMVEAVGTVRVEPVGMEDMGESLLGVDMGTDPFEVVAPVFTRKEMWQTSPVAGGNNTLSLELSCSVEISQGVVSSLTISGLKDAEPLQLINGSSVRVQDSSEGELFCDAQGRHGRGTWVSNSSIPYLVVHVCEQRIPAGTVFTVSVDVRNPGADQVSPDVKVASEGPLFRIEETAVSRRGEEVLGVVAGSDPLRVLVLAFSERSMKLSMPLAGLNNTLTLVLVPVVDLAGGSVVTLTGLHPGSILPDGEVDLKVALSVASGGAGATFCAGAGEGAGDVGTWDGQALSLEMRVCEGHEISANSRVTVEFSFMNPMREHLSPDVFVSATSGAGSFAPLLVRKPSRSCDNDAEEMFGIVGSLDPLRVVLPLFVQLSIEQSTPLAGEANLISAVIETNVELSGQDSATVAVRGLKLRGTNASIFEGDSVQVNAYIGEEFGWADGLFCDTSGLRNRIAWDEDEGTLMLALCAGAAMEPFVAYTVEVNFTNPYMDHTGALMHVAARGGAVSIAPSVMKLSVESSLGVPGGLSPLYILVPRFLTSSMGQQTPFASEDNTLTVTLEANVELRGVTQAEVVFTGLIRESWGVTTMSTEAWGAEGVALLLGNQRLVLAEQRGNTIVMVDLLPGQPGKDTFNHAIRMVNLSTKEVWTLAGEVLVADTGNNLVRIVQMDEALRGVSVATLAGGGGAGQFDGPETPTAGYADGVGTAALFREPTEICVIETAEGIVAFVADSHNFRVRKIVLSEDRRSGVVTTLLGTGEYGSADGSWRRASFKGLSGLAVSPDGKEVIVADDGAGTLRRALLRGGLLFHGPTVAINQSLVWRNGPGYTPLFCDEHGNPAASWDASMQELRLRVCPDATLRRGEAVHLSFTVKNPRTEQDAPAILVEARGVATITPHLVTSPGTPLFGVAAGADPLFVVVCNEWKIAKIAQTMPFSGMNNTVTLTSAAALLGSDSSMVALRGMVRAFFGPSDVVSVVVERRSVRSTAASGGNLSLPTNSPSTVQEAWAGEHLFCHPDALHPLEVVPPKLWSSVCDPSSPTFDPFAAACFEIQFGQAPVNVGVWASDGKLELHLCSPATLVPSAVYRFILNVVNPPGVDPAGGNHVLVHSPEVTVEASGTFTIEGTNASKTGALLLGVPQGSDPFEVINPAFTAKKIEQDSPMATARNTITLQVGLSVEVSRNVVSRLKVSALNGAAPIDAIISPDGNHTAIPVVVRGEGGSHLAGAFCDSQGLRDHGSWSDNNGAPTLEFFLCPNRNTIIHPSTVLTISFDVRNPASKQHSPAVRISADGPLFAVPEVVATSPGTDLLGVTRGKDALEVEEPAFVIKEISQNMPFAGRLNELSVKLRTNVDLIEGTILTLAGLAPFSIITSAEVLLEQTGGNGTSGGLFCAGGDAEKAGKGIWDDGILFLSVCENQTMFAVHNYMVLFSVTNPKASQSSPDVSIGVDRSVSEPKDPHIAPSSMKKPSTGTVDSRGCDVVSSVSSLLGVDGGNDPLMVVIPIFSVARVAQSLPVVLASNRLFVTLQTNSQLLGGSSFILIEGFAISNWAVQPYPLIPTFQRGVAGLTRLGRLYLAVVEAGMHAVTLVRISTGVEVARFGPSSGVEGFMDGDAADARFRYPSAIVFVDSGNADEGTFAGVEAVIVDRGNHLIRKLRHSESMNRFVISTLAGLPPVNDVPTAGGADGPGFNDPSDAVFVWHAGTLRLIVVDGGNNRLKMVDAATGAVSVLAGSGSLPGFIDGPASSAEFNFPRGIAVTASGMILITDTGNNAIRCLDLSSPILEVATLVGSSIGASGMLDGVGAAASFNAPTRISMYDANHAIVADWGSHAVRFLDVFTRAVTTVAGTGGRGFTDGKATEATFSSPMGVCSLDDGTILISDTDLPYLRALSITGTTKELEEGPVALSAVVGFEGPQLFCPDYTGAPGFGTWLGSALRLHVCEGRSLLGSEIYVFSFLITNPAEACTSPNIKIRAEGPATIAVRLMDKPGASLLGIDKGSDPLQTVVPEMPRFAASHSS
ncbi:hypothetical protein T484DRAFT_1861908 [Baffinella frigidus]|nr:hypothetical protein T484DRAFT_1861908 [Cryptophyta sp. CCMP2293]